MSASDEVLSRVNSQMGRTVIRKATDERFTLQRVPIGILTLERITGGGFARGRHTEIFGDESTGKSLAAYMTMVLAQQRGEVCAVIDGEHIFSESWFEHLGGNALDLLMAWPETAEETVQVLMAFAQPHDNADSVSIVTVDSVASLLPREELEHDISDGKDDRMASLARLMSKGLRRATTINRDTTFIWTNQTREKIGSFYGGKTTPGGRALSFYASTRIEMQKGKQVKAKRNVAREGKMASKDLPVGHWVQIRTVKNKTMRPYQEQMFFLDTEQMRVDPTIEILHLGMEDGLIETRERGKQTIYSYVDDEKNEYEGTLKDWKNWIDADDGPREELVELISQNTILLADGD